MGLSYLRLLVWTTLLAGFVGAAPSVQRDGSVGLGRTVLSDRVATLGTIIGRNDQPGLQTRAAPVCGNEIVEEGEECDSNGPCCDPKTCKFKEGAVCDSSDPTQTCCVSCSFRPKSHQCFYKRDDECDTGMPHYCPGNSGFCPQAYHEMDGWSCGSYSDDPFEPRSCANGYCTSPDYECSQESETGKRLIEDINKRLRSEKSKYYLHLMMGYCSHYTMPKDANRCEITCNIGYMERGLKDRRYGTGGPVTHGCERSLYPLYLPNGTRCGDWNTAGAYGTCIDNVCVLETPTDASASSPYRTAPAYQTFPSPEREAWEPEPTENPWDVYVPPPEPLLSATHIVIIVLSLCVVIALGLYFYFAKRIDKAEKAAKNAAGGETSGGGGSSRRVYNNEKFVVQSHMERLETITEVETRDEVLSKDGASIAEGKETGMEAVKEEGSKEGNVREKVNVTTLELDTDVISVESDCKAGMSAAEDNKKA
ncbi:hypothetical protein BJ508DRAFT_381894 [Ascobolus immersus RN42]|uniref:Disintegrin domain-containing protein n=1 Tax=Ascobolus immersus RN42 TaxID=1160509 RepID=A0A3N4HDP2_ASCIM|nr:hypothetical protein BJ508DRAFT_381894 [Ascobolus immersus RN42]